VTATSPAIATAAASTAAAIASVTTTAAAAAKAAATTATATAATKAAAATAAATTATRARAPLLGFVHAERATVEIGTVHLLDCLLRTLGRRHRHEGKPTRAARLAIQDQLGFRYLTTLGKEPLDRVLGRVECEVSDVKLGVHLIQLRRAVAPILAAFEYGSPRGRNLGVLVSATTADSQDRCRRIDFPRSRERGEQAVTENAVSLRG
jgi:hypothetical protein